MTDQAVVQDAAAILDPAAEPDGRAPIPEPARAIAPAGPSDPATERRLALAKAVLRIVRRTIADPTRLAIDLEDGAAGVPVMETVRPSARVVVHGPDAVGRLLFPPLPDTFAEAYLRGDIEIEGDVVEAVEAGGSLDLRRLGADDARRLLRWAIELRRGAKEATRLARVARMQGARHSRARDLEAIRFHYDVGNEFFALWLDRRLAYSCAYFPAGATPRDAASLLDEAQEAKLDLISSKLRLRPGVRVLDIGCGWGSLIGFAAERHGAEAVGVTLSALQANEANRRLAASGLESTARAMVLDYRDLDGLGTFDAVASVGMFEHVGRANLPAYFRAAWDALRPGGLFLNHGIAKAGRAAGATRLGRRESTPPFMQRYVFPDGELVPVDEAVAQARMAGFEVLDVQSLRPHYALTLAAWVARLEASWDAAVAAGGEEVARTWRLYMSAARNGFEHGDTDVCQLLLARPLDEGTPARLPLRPWW